MIGAIVGDIAGSRFEWENIKTKEFDLLHKNCHFTDDSLMSLAICQALMNCKGCIENLSEETVNCMQALGNAYMPVGFGPSFREWLKSDKPMPYNSWGNGAAMRVSGCAYVAKTLEEAIELSKKVTIVTHNHPEGIKGAEATTVATFLARMGWQKDEIGKYIREHYYDICFTLDDIREEYTFDVSCQGSVPQALEAFFESSNYEDAIRNAISIGGDSDTIAAITGAVAGAYYGVPADIRVRAISYLDDRLLEILLAFEKRYC